MKHSPIHRLSVGVLFLFFWSPALFNVWIPGAQAEQALGLKLVGTAVTDDPSQNFAIIEHQSTGSQGAFREGDRLGEILIKKVLSESVVISTRMGDETLYMSSGGATDRPPSSGEIARLDRKEVDSTFPDPTQLMQDIRVRAHFEGGKPSGFLIYGIEPESIFARMGLNDGDIIVSVNGRSFTTTAPTMEFYNALKRGGTVSLEIKRGESKQELHFGIQ